jgi:hypothetical protein
MKETEKLTQLASELPYPESMLPIKGIGGKSFFPGGRGLWKDADQTVSTKKYMILGQDFDTVEAFEKAKHNGQEDISKNATWRNLLGFLKDCSISEADCFFTNVIMGARKEGSNSGRSPAFKDREFIAACQEFFLVQLVIQKPELILVLGKEPARFLSSLSPQLDFWKKEQSFAKIDEAGEQVKRNVVFRNGVSTNLVLLTHPSFWPVNVHRRRFDGKKGHEAEVGMVWSVK